MYRIAAFIVLFGLVSQAKSQDLNIYLATPSLDLISGEDISGSVIEQVVEAGSLNQVHFVFENISEETLDISMAVSEIELAESASHYLIYGSDLIDNSEYLPEGEYFVCDDSYSIPSDDSGYFTSGYHPGDGPGCTYLRYYLLNSETLEKLDSMDVSYCSVVGVDENISFEYSIYPNPSKGNVIIELPESGKIQISDLQGKIIDTKQLDEGLNQVHLSSTQKGVYLITFISAESNRRIFENRLVLD